MHARTCICVRELVKAVAKGDYMAKVDKWLKSKNLEQLTLWASDKEKTISQIARLMGISASTFHEWKNKYSEICEAFENGRRVVDEGVESEFFKSCFGRREKVKKAHKVRRWKLDEKGKRIEEYEEFILVEEEVFIPPVWAAQEFYLLNRMPDKYRAKNAVLPAGKDDEENTGIVVLSEIEEDNGEVIDAEIVE